MRKLFENKAVSFDAHLQPANTEWYYDFALEATAECFNFLDWEFYYVDAYIEANRTIIIKHYHQEMVTIYIEITADPIDDDDDQWLVFDIFIDEPIRFYQFHLQ